MLVYPTGIPTGAAGYTIENSLWFDGSADYLHFTPSSTTGNKKFTFSCWLKLDAQNAHKTPFSAWTDNNNRCAISIEDTGFLDFHSDVSGSRITDLHTTSKYLDPTGWFHLILVYDSTVSTPSGSSIFYMINGTKVVENGYGNLDAHVYPSQNGVTQFNTSGVQMAIGMNNYDNSPQSFYEGYMAEVIFLDGIVTSDGSEFGEYDDNGVWVPVKPSGLTFGTNGFHLDFKVAPGTGNGAGTDVSGNGNHFTENSLTAAQQVTDTPTDNAESIGNYCTWNPLARSSANSTSTFSTLSNGNLTTTASGSVYNFEMPTFQVDSGKWYFEVELDNDAGANWVGVAQTFLKKPSNGDDAGIGDLNGYAYRDSNGNKVNASGTSSSYGATYTTGNVIGVALDLDNGAIWFSKDDAWQASATKAEIEAGTTTNAAFTGLTGRFGPMVQMSSSGAVFILNTGQTAFAGTKPTGFKALNTANLPAPTVTKPDDFFKTVLYTANNSDGHEISTAGFVPDFVWIKDRDTAASHVVFDIVRGVSPSSNNYLTVNTTDTENQGSFTNTMVQLGKAANGSTVINGFTLDDDSNDQRVNYGGAMVAWCWKAGGAASSNSDGNVTGGSSVSVASHNGFAIVTYGDCGGAAKTIGHGMGKAPDMIIVMCRNASRNRRVYHKDLSSDHVLYLDTVEPQASEAASFGTIGTSTFGVDGGPGTSASGETHVAYCFARTPGLIAVGSFEGANAADGSYIVLDDGASGFKPAFFMFKNIDSNGDWYTFDSTRNTYNPVNSLLAFNQSHNESTMASNSSNGTVDFTTNGVKFRSTNGSDFQGAKTFIYLAFAENPFGGEDVAQAKAR